MLNPKLRSVCEFVEGWCHSHRLNYSVVCDESDLQGLMLPRSGRALLPKLLADLGAVVTATGVHLETTKVRGGTILAFSIKAISEAKLAALIAEAGEEVEPMSFADKITDAFSQTVARPISEDPSEVTAGSLLMTALRVVDEGQYKGATGGMTRANQTSLQRQRVGSDNTMGGPKAKPVPSDKPQATTGASQPSTGPAARFEHRIADTFGVAPLPSRLKLFNKHLNETLGAMPAGGMGQPGMQGMATPNGMQPGDLFDKFAKSLQVMGQSMGTGPLQDQLKKQGINWKKSDDGQSIILYIVNASTNAPQPIARISAATLEKPADFETQLLNIMDFAKGDAPGTFKQRQQEMQNQEKAAREIAKQMGPQDQTAVSQQLAAPQQPGLQGMATPDQGPAVGGPVQQPATQQAATQAAMPKPGM